MQVACLSGGFLCRVKSACEAKAAERLGAVGILLDSSTDDDFREILSVISVHPLTLGRGSSNNSQASLLASMDVPDSFTFVTAPHEKNSSSSPERFVLELMSTLEDIPEDFDQEIMIV